MHNKLYSDALLNNPDWSVVFAPNGHLLKAGDIIRRTNLSRTLSYIAENGPEAFYKVSLRTYLSAVLLYSSLQGSYREFDREKSAVDGGHTISYRPRRLSR